MSIFVSGHNKLAGDIANALGIKNCRMLEIRFRVNEVATVLAEVFLTEDEIKKIGTILKEYHLVEKPKE